MTAVGMAPTEMRPEEGHDDPIALILVIIGGQPVEPIVHCHVHLIPRRKGDEKNPRGGVRKVFPKRADY